jgi:L-iditol 2-dehydrogenase
MPEDVAVIAGPGAIGLLTLQIVRAAGAQVIMLGTEADAHRLQMASKLGASQTFNVERDEFGAAIDELTGEEGADIVYECSGAGSAAQMLLDLVRRGGQYAQIGLFGKPVTWNLEQVCYKELTVTGSFASVPSAWVRAIRLMEDGIVNLEPLVSGVFPLSEWRKAFDIFENRTGLKTVLQPDEEVS